MLKHTVLLCFVFFITCVGIAQQKIVFTNIDKGKIVYVQQNDMVKLLFQGYLGQIQQAYGKVELVTDSFVRFEGSWNVRIKDIIGFRKFSKYRELLQASTQIITIVGTIIAVPSILNNNPSLSTIEGLGITFGIGAGASLIQRLIFPSRIKNYIGDGWIVWVE